MVIGIFGSEILQISCALALFAACFGVLVVKNGKHVCFEKFVWLSFSLNFEILGGRFCYKADVSVIFPLENASPTF